MKALTLALMITAMPLTGWAEDLSKLNNDQLIGQLATLDNQATGWNGTGLFSAFDPTLENLRASCASPAPVVHYRTASLSPATAELLRRGPEALPALLKHLDDATPTKLLLAKAAGGPSDTPWLGFGWGGLVARYDPRQGPIQNNNYVIATSAENALFAENFADIGDISYVLIGQIVNRDLEISRYAPSGGASLTSPIRSPKLVSLTRTDWSGLTREQHRESLLSDARQGKDGYERDRALLKLKYYYPETYAGLADSDLTLRTAFEKRVCANRFGTLDPPAKTAARIAPDGR